MNVKLIAYTPEPEKVVAAAAKLCYSAAELDDLLESLTPEKTTKFLSRLLSLGHESPLEHVSFTFGIEGVSRALLAQITRHRIASFSVQSQRYCDMSETEFVLPELASDEDNPDAAKKMTNAFKESMKTYKELLEMGIPKEDARIVLPNSTATRMIVTMNARELRHFFKLRCCNRAQFEIRFLATEMYSLAYQAAPNLFKNAGPDCVSKGVCPEGKMSCGKGEQMRERFWQLQEAAQNKSVPQRGNPFWERVCKIAEKQRAKGIHDYGQGIEDNDADLHTRVDMALEELVDLAMYLCWTEEGSKQ